MEDLLQAFISFFTDFFAALTEFLGEDFGLGEILGDLDLSELGGLLGGEATE